MSMSNTVIVRTNNHRVSLSISVVMAAAYMEVCPAVAPQSPCVTTPVTGVQPSVRTPATPTIQGLRIPTDALVPTSPGASSGSTSAMVTLTVLMAAMSWSVPGRYPWTSPTLCSFAGPYSHLPAQSFCLSMVSQGNTLVFSLVALSCFIPTFTLP